MSLADELDDFFDDESEVLVQEPLKFKAMLGIGERAYGLLRARENMSTFSETIGIGATASTIAASSTVAGTFFASSGFMASTLSAIGLGATAVTPVGWVIAAGVLTGGAYLGVSHMFEKSKDTGLIVIPKYINTPLDVIAAALIELMLPVSLKMAHTGGGMNKHERDAIQAYFSDSWGYSPGFVSRLVDEYKEQLDLVSYERLAESLGSYCTDSKDCDREAIMAGFISHLREVAEADGVIHEDEKSQLDYFTSLLIEESENAGGSSLVTDALKQASEGFSSTTQTAAELATNLGAATATGISRGTDYVTETGKTALQKSSTLIREISTSENAKSILKSSTDIANKSSELASVGLEAGKTFATEAGELAAKKAKSLWGKFSSLRDMDGEERT